VGHALSQTSCREACASAAWMVHGAAGAGRALGQSPPARDAKRIAHDTRDRACVPTPRNSGRSSVGHTERVAAGCGPAASDHRQALVCPLLRLGVDPLTQSYPRSTNPPTPRAPLPPLPSLHGSDSSGRSAGLTEGQSSVWHTQQEKSM
jgi:hypothetical protein